MKRYLLFKYRTFYPGGGWNDFEGMFDTLEEATIKGEALEFEGDEWNNYCVVDSTTMTKVKES